MITLGFTHSASGITNESALTTNPVFMKVFTLKVFTLVSDLFLEDGRIVPFDKWVDKGV